MPVGREPLSLRQPRVGTLRRHGQNPLSRSSERPRRGPRFEIHCVSPVEEPAADAENWETLCNRQPRRRRHRRQASARAPSSEHVS